MIYVLAAYNGIIIKNAVSFYLSSAAAVTKKPETF
jgi:hypothetical protein